MSYQGHLIHRERLRRHWNQAGLCKGICTVGYLSKIEAGKAEPSEDVLRLLLHRLDLQTDGALESESAKLAEEAYALFLSGQTKEACALLDEPTVRKHQATAAGLDLLLIRAAAGMDSSVDAALLPCMDARQQAMYALAVGQEEQAARLYPHPLTYLCAGYALYRSGSYTASADFLRHAYDRAAEEGFVLLMLDAQLFLGNCASDQQEIETMERHYRIAKAIASALKSESTLRSIEYNEAATWIELGRYESAYPVFAALAQPSRIALHKLAVCCEATGRLDEAISALDRADAMPAETETDLLEAKLCAVVRYRLEHPDYLRRTAYGQLLQDVFDRCEKHQRGFALFHLPRMLEWYESNKQYRQAEQLLKKLRKLP